MGAEKKKEILQKLLITEEDTIKKFEELIDKSRKLFAIDARNGNIIIESPQMLTNAEKACLFLIGKYFANQLEIVEQDSFTLSELSDELLIKGTTLSNPMSKLTMAGYVRREEGSYQVNHYKIEEILDSILLKGPEAQPKVSPGLSLPKATLSKGGNGKKKSKKTSASKNEKSVEDQISQITYTKNPRGIEDLIRDLDTDDDLLATVFEFEDNEFFILSKKHCDNDADEAFYNSILYLTASSYHFNQRELPSKELKAFLTEFNINLHHFKRDMTRKNRRLYVLYKPSQDTYKITENGIKLGLSIIQELIPK